MLLGGCDSLFRVQPLLQLELSVATLSGQLQLLLAPGK